MAIKETKWIIMRKGRIWTDGHWIKLKKSKPVEVATWPSKEDCEAFIELNRIPGVATPLHLFDPPEKEPKEVIATVMICGERDVNIKDLDITVKFGKWRGGVDGMIKAINGRDATRRHLTKMFAEMFDESEKFVLVHFNDECPDCGAIKGNAKKCPRPDCPNNLPSEEEIPL